MRPIHAPYLICAAIIAIFGARSVYAVGTMAVVDETEENFQEGELKSTSLSSEGVLTIAPALGKPVSTGEPVVWDIVPTDGGNLYISTGHEGKVFRLKPEETSPTLVCDLKEVEATALALSSDKTLYVGASPGGMIYRIANDDTPTTLTVLEDAYVWDLLSIKQTLYAATGVKGNIYSIDSNGKAELFFESKCANVLSLTENPDGSILACTEDPGLLLQINTDKTIKVLLDGSPYTEVRKAVTGKDGAIYAILNGRGGGSPEAARFEALKAALGTLAEPGSDSAPTAPVQSRPRPGGPELESQIVRINSNGFVQTIWFSPESPIHSIYYDKDSDMLLAGVGEKGVLFEIEQNGKYSRALQVAQRSIMTLAYNESSCFLGTAESGVVYNLSRQQGLRGVYLSRSLDAGDPVQWGAMHVRATTPEGTSVTLALRRGNSSEPDDKLWSPWSAEYTPQNGYVKIGGAPSRFIQYRATLTRSGAEAPSPLLDTVEAFYLTPNLAPVIKSVTVGAPKKKPPQQPKGSPLAALLMQAQSMEEEAEQGESKKIAPEPNNNPKMVEVQWEVEEPNADNFETDLFFKGENETTWKKINKEPFKDQSNHTLITVTIPDGEYRVKVVISDRPSNPLDLTKESEAISDRFYVDNTPPEIEFESAKQVDGLNVLVTAAVKDATTTIADAKYNIDAGEWQQVFPKDHLFDLDSEQFEFVIKFEEPGEHTVTLLVSDRKGNTALEKRVVKVEPASP